MSEQPMPADDWKTAIRNDPRPTWDLINIALSESDEEKAWDAIGVLHFRANREVFDAAAKLCGSECPTERSLGASILGQIGVEQRLFLDQSLTVLLDSLSKERDVEAFQSICFALGHRGDQRAIAPVLELRQHPDANVRYAVVHALSCHADERAIQGLIELTLDTDPLVRDWATFGIGSLIEIDSPAIRTALFRRIHDEDDDVRGEALVGLARRGDPRVIEPLIHELDSHNSNHYVIEAASLIGATRLPDNATHHS
jgi:HEAT repeat protein